MRQALALALMIIMLACLCSCGGEAPEKAATEMRNDFLGAENISAELTMLADTGGEVFSFSMSYTGTSSSGSVCVLSPECVSGLTADVSVDDVTVTYDGLELTVGTIADGITPISVIPVLMDQWKYGYMENCRYDNADGFSLFAFDTHITDSVTQTTWFTDGGTPLRSEIYDGGYMVIAVNYTNFQR